MLRVCSKNTFLDFVEYDDDDDQGITPFQGPAKAASFGFERLSNTRSEDGPQEDPQEVLTSMQLERLNMVLDLNQLQESGTPTCKRTSGFQEAEVAPAVNSIPMDDGMSEGVSQEETDLSELIDLQQRLSEALATSPTTVNSAMTFSRPQCHDAIGKVAPKSNFHRQVSGKQVMLAEMPNVMSNNSISTMAPTDESGSEASEVRRPRMPKVVSSGSVCTMVSDLSMISDLSENCSSELELHTAESNPRYLEDADSTLKNCLQPEFSHSQVPRNQNLAEEFERSSHEAPPTTMMIRNIPSRYSQNDLMMDLRDLGFTGSFDFLYMPMDKGTASNVGYAFVNFIDHQWAAKCMDSFQGYRFRRQRKGAGKVASVSVAHMQGLEKNLLHYEHAAVNTSKLMQRRPVIIANISSMLSSAV
mmetsp:Transcript_152131/g.283452  ORF Transcript_152131/g.283452 Transcript_152131/m.283452 type:complete len:416 (+) Transcript_152131:57-1304(+)